MTSGVYKRKKETLENKSLSMIGKNKGKKYPNRKGVKCTETHKENLSGKRNGM